MLLNKVLATKINRAETRVAIRLKPETPALQATPLNSIKWNTCVVIKLFPNMTNF